MSEKPRKVLLIGWDGADWKVASPLLDAGHMPNLKRLIDGGVMGNIATLSPVLSPMLWTSIATGKRAHKHGIHGFVEPDPRTGSVRPVTNLGRRCKAVWNILNQSGKRCNVVAWWPSHPAEPINGVMVSNHFQTAVAPHDKPWPLQPRTIHPPELGERLSKFRVHPSEIEAGQILPFVPRAAEVDQEKDERLGAVARNLAQVSGVHAVATAIMQHEPWDFMAVYYDAIDHFCHGFMRYHPPRPEWVNEEDFETYKEVVTSAYRFHDMMLGALLALAGEDTTIILLSDHGFHPDHLRPQMIGNEPAGPADEHRQFGMFVMNGPGIKRDDLVFGTSLLDIAPTVLTLFGLPVGRDMDGKAVRSAFVDEPEIELIESWEKIEGEDGRHDADAQIDPVDAHESLKQLAELGYIEEPGEDKQQAAADAIRELRYNLARDYFDARKIPEAAREFQALWDAHPDEGRFGVKLFNCSLAMDDADRAETTLNRLIEEKKRYARDARKELETLRAERESRQKKAETDPAGEEDESKRRDLKETERERRELQKLRKLSRRAQTNPAAFAYFRGCLLHAKGAFREALEVLQKAEGVQQYNQPSLRQKIGECYLGLEEWSKAREQFQGILEIDPINADAHMGLARCELGENRPREAYTAAASAVGLVYHNPKAHYLLGKSLFRMGRLEDAITHLTTALEQNPVFPDCHRLLAQIHLRRGDSAQADEHDSLAQAAYARIERFRSGESLAEDADLALDGVMREAIGIGEIHANGSIDQSEGPPIVIVSGLPRSGTSMMMQMLTAGGLPALTDDHRPADESNPRGYYEFEPAKQLGKNNDWVAKARGHVVKVIAQLLPGLPAGHRYRIIFMARPLAEIVASQSAMLARLGREGGSLSDRQLAATYRKQIDRIGRMLADHDHIAAITIDYHEALTDSAAVAKRLNAFLGGGLDEAAMASAVDPSLRRERQSAPA